MRGLAFLAFFLSGASSLIFQSIWSRHLAHVFGASSVAISTTVTIFMAGLGLGAYVAGKVADRIKHPLISYGVVEGIVGIWALLVPFMVNPEGWLADVNAYLRNDLGAESGGFMIARFLLVLPILIVPTTLMGTSLPLLARHFVNRETKTGAVGSWVGALYSVNTFGAVAGVGFGGFILLPNFGISVTNVIAASMNLFLFASIFLFRRFLLQGEWEPGEKLEFLPAKANAAADSDEEESDVEESEASDEAEDREENDGKPADYRSSAKDDADEIKPGSSIDLDAPALNIPPIARKLALFAFAASGLASLCYEVVWTRSLAMTVGSSFQSFQLMLMAFLIGIGGGSAIASGAISHRRMLSTSCISSMLLVLFGTAAWGVDQNLTTWAITATVFMLPIALIWAVVAARRASALAALEDEAKRREESDDDEDEEFEASQLVTAPVIPSLLVLTVPVIAALVTAVGLGDGALAGLSGIIAAVTVTVAAFVAIMIGLRRYPVLQLAVLTLYIALAAFVNYAFQDEIPCAFASLVATLDRLFDHVALVRGFMFLTVILCVLPATVGMGAMFPLVLRIWTSGGADIGKDVGTVYAGNTLGSILGAWLPGFVLMSVLGLEPTIIVGMFVYLGVSLFLLVGAASDRGEAALREKGDEEGARKLAPPTNYAMAVYVLAPLIPPICVVLGVLWGQPHRFDLLESLRWDRSRMTLGVFRVSLAENACSEQWGEPDLLYYNDGMSTTVTVERWGRHIALKNNGKVDASNGDDMPTQIMVAAYPLLMHENGPQDLDVAVVGFGSGVSVGTALTFPTASVDVIELEGSILDASRHFADVNNLEYPLGEFPYVEMDRLTVINDDGRNYLASTDREYDVIVSEPSNPWITGVSDLFTTDHFRITKRRLREGGIYCQWVQLYELSPENIKTIYRTFASQFEHVAVFAAEDLSSDTVLLGSDSPLPLDLGRIRRAFELPAVAEELERADVHSPYDVFARTLIASRDEVMSFSQIEYRRRGGQMTAYPDSNNDPDIGCTAPDCRRDAVVLNTDDNAHIEFQAPRDLIGFERFEGYLSNFYSPEWPYGHVFDHISGFGEGDAAAEAMSEMAMALIGHGKKPEAARFITAARDHGDSRTTLIAAEVLTRLMSSEMEPTLLVETPVPGPQLAARQARQLREGFAAVRHAVDQGNFVAALSAMEEIPAPVRMHSGPGLRMLHGYILYKTAPTYSSRYRDAIEQFEDLIRTEQDYVRRHTEIYYFLARCHDAELNFDKALRNMRAFVELRLLLQEELRRAEEEAAQEASEDGTTDAESAEGEEADVEAQSERTELVPGSNR